MMPAASYAQGTDADLGDSGSGSSSSAKDSGLGEEMESLFSDQQKQADQAEDKAEEQLQQNPQTKEGEVQVKELADLAKLAPFSDVAMLQRRYMPRTGRFEAYLGLNTILNDAFFTAVGADARLAYYFTEKYGLEATALMLASGDRQTTKDLRNKIGIATTSLIAPKSYFGADFKWSPVYGKMSYMNRKIIHYDMYFAAGGGSTTHSSGSSPTFHIGTGQNFALSKALTFRWNLDLNMYSATSKVGGNSTSGSYQNLYLGAGLSYFFPEAGYR